MAALVQPVAALVRATTGLRIVSVGVALHVNVAYVRDADGVVRIHTLPCCVIVFCKDMATPVKKWPCKVHLPNHIYDDAES
jgi:hypothetical protein